MEKAVINFNCKFLFFFRILALSEPHLKPSQRETIEAATEKYTMNYLAAIENGDILSETTTELTDTGKSSTPKRVNVARKQEHGKIYTMADVLERTSKGGKLSCENSAPSAKKPKKFGVWSEVANDDLDWGKCPLGKIVWE